jgi:hypothetical protein
MRGCRTGAGKTNHTERRYFEAQLEAEPRHARESTHGLMRGSSRGVRRRWRAKRVGGGRPPHLPRLCGTNPGEGLRPTLRISRGGEESCTSPRSNGRALRWLPNEHQLPSGILGREAEAREVAVEVRRSQSFGGRISSSSFARSARARQKSQERLRGEISRAAKPRAEQNVKRVKTRKTQSAGVGIPARCPKRIGSLDGQRTLHAVGDVEGERNPMRGGRTHWADT